MTRGQRKRGKTLVRVDRARGGPLAVIAERHSISERTIRRYPSQGPPRGPMPDVTAAVAELLASLDATIEDLAVLAATTANDSVKIAALRERRDSVFARFRAMQDLGLVPRSFRAERARATMAALLEEFAELLREHDI